jgi:hypothetical protein
MRLIVLLVVGLIAVSPRTADACACCDAAHSKTPLGWSDAGGALLVEARTNGCQPQHYLMIYTLGVNAPSGCYDLYDAPDKRVSCDQIDRDNDRKKSKKSTIPKKFPNKPAKLESARVKLTSTAAPEQDGQRVWKVKVTIDGKTVVDDKDFFASHVDAVTVWPNPRGDRALVLLAYTEQGHGHEGVHGRWIELPKPTP